jgi:hypothetical protein
VDILGAAYRPEAALVRVLGDLVRPMHGTFRAQPRKQLVRGTVEPQWPLADPNIP